MPDATFLHIQSGEGLPARVLELSGHSVRIGRGARCEVRLGEPALAEVQCLLCRRGATWHVQPVGPSGRISIAGRPVEQQRPLPLGVPLRVGDTWLTLRSAAAGSTSPFGTFETPLPADTEVVYGTNVPPIEAAPLADHAYADPTLRPGFEPPTGSCLEDERDRLSRWEARLEGRERNLRERARELRWEARWRALGEGLKARTPAPVPDRSRQESTPPPPEPAPPPKPGAPRSPSPARPPTASGANRALVFSFPGSPEAPQAEAAREFEPTTREILPQRPGPPTPAPRSEDVVPLDEPPAPLASVFVPAATGSTSDPAPLVPHPADISDPRPLQRPGETDGNGAGPTSEPGADSAAADDPARASEPGPFSAQTAPLVHHQGPDEARDTDTAADPETPSRVEPARPRDPNTDEPAWPSVRDILASASAQTGGGPRAQHATSDRRRGSRSRPRHPVPTAGQRPAEWRLPTWLAAPAALLLVLTLGLAGLRLTWTWAQDDFAAGRIADLLLKADALPTQPIEPPPAPEPSWWTSTAGHLHLRALAESLAEPEPGRDEAVLHLLQTARGASPLAPGPRLALAALAGESPPESVSRDVAAWHRLGNLHQRAGRTDEAIHAYRTALELALAADPLRAPPPSFFDTAKFRRFALPLEEPLMAILGDLFEVIGANPEQWQVILPDSPVAALAAYRVLLERSPTEARRALEQVRSAGDPPGGSAGALHRAAQAEALALSGQLDEAAERYRDAIREFPPGAIRRRLSFNLADVESRRGNRDAMLAAREDARGPDLRDEVNRRLAEARVRETRPTAPAPTLAGADPAPRDSAVAPATFERNDRPRP